MPQGIYLPEGMLEQIVVPLGEAWADGRILRGRAVSCSPQHDLLVEYGGRRLTMERGQCAAGLEDGSVRDIAVLSRVGKPICFRVLDHTGFEPVISRAVVQREAKEWLLGGGLQPGEVIQTVVTHLEPFGAFVDVGCGVTSFIGIERISVSRIGHPSQRFALHQQVPAVVTGVDREKAHLLLSHRELLGTWEDNADRFRPGQTVEGTVRTVEPYGIFVELTPNLSGLAEYRPGLAPGMAVSVFIKSILPDRMKIKLLIIDRLPQREEPVLTPDDYFITEGRLDLWQYSPPACTAKRICTAF